MKSRRFVVIAVFAMMVACSDAPVPVPPPNELGPRIEAVRAIVLKNEAALDAGPIESHIEALEATIAGIAAEYGEQSVETVQALTETSVLLTKSKRWDLALPFMERTLALSREVYGLEHRETAYGMHDVASILAEMAPGEYVARAEFLYRGAVDVRRRQAGADDPETAASETQLAWQLLLGAKQESLPYRKYPILAESEHLALHAQRVFDAHKDKSYWFQVRRTLVETAFARGDYMEVEKRARALLEDRDYEKGPGLYPDATASDLLAKALELQAKMLPDVELPQARSLQ